jgi:hypothetical protein
MSDALFAITMAREFTCQCDDDPDHPCAADIITVPAGGVISGIDAKIVLHAIANQATLDGNDEQPAHLEGHGVINADHARELADQTHTIIRPLGNPTTSAPKPCPKSAPPNRKARRAAKKTARMQAPPIEESGFQVIPLPVVQPGDHYRPSAVLDAFIRIRNCYCTWPGCNKSAWTAGLDHTAEYNHQNPEAGGRTHPTGMKALCRLHHLLKTHTENRMGHTLPTTPDATST